LNKKGAKRKDRENSHRELCDEHHHHGQLNVQVQRGRQQQSQLGQTLKERKRGMEWNERECVNSLVAEVPVKVRKSERG